MELVLAFNRYHAAPAGRLQRWLGIVQLSAFWRARTSSTMEEKAAAPADSALIEAARRGDRSAYRELYERYSASVFNFLKRATGNETEAEDLLQDVFLRAFRALDRYEARASFRTWLFVITRNRLRSHWGRRQAPEEQFEDQSPPAAAAIETQTPLRIAENKQAWERTEQSIACLPPLYREIFLLRQVHGLSYQELCNVLKLPMGTVKSRLTRALAEFGRLMERAER